MQSPAVDIPWCRASCWAQQPPVSIRRSVPRYRARKQSGCIGKKQKSILESGEWTILCKGRNTNFVFSRLIYLREQLADTWPGEIRFFIITFWWDSPEIGWLSHIPEQKCLKRLGHCFCLNYQNTEKHRPAQRHFQPSYPVMFWARKLCFLIQNILYMYQGCCQPADELLCLWICCRIGKIWMFALCISMVFKVQAEYCHAKFMPYSHLQTSIGHHRTSKLKYFNQNWCSISFLAKTCQSLSPLVGNRWPS